MKPTARLLAVLELLQTHGLLSGAEIARRLGVDGRTVRRQIARLEELGIPITAERGSHGGYRLVPGYKLPPMMFTADEALALSLGLLAARGLGLGEAGPGVDSARAKLERVMPAGLRSRLRAADETVVLDLMAGGSPGAGAHLATVTAAAQAGKRLHLSYRSASGRETERRFDPYGLACRSGRWYVVGHCHLRGALRSLRLDRLRAASQREETFQRPPGFDALEHLTRSVATLPRRYAVEVLLLADLATATAAVFPTLGVLQPAPEGVVLASQTDDLDWMARELARFPFPFRVLRPAALVAALRRHAERLLAAADRDRTLAATSPAGS